MLSLVESFTEEWESYPRKTIPAPIQLLFEISEFL